MHTRSKVFAVTGATGNTGSKLTELLLEQGKEVRAIARGRERLQALGKKGAVTHAGSLDDVHFPANSLKGAGGVFLMLPPNYTADHVQAYQQSLSDAAVEAIRQAEVPRVVALNSFGARLPEGAGPISGLHYLEERLGSLQGVDVLCLRAGFFMENFLQNIEMIKHRGHPEVPRRRRHFQERGGKLRGDVQGPERRPRQAHGGPLPEKHYVHEHRGVVPHLHRGVRRACAGQVSLSRLTPRRDWPSTRPQEAGTKPASCLVHAAMA